MPPDPLPEQEAFIALGGDQDAVLVAGPGTGKTWVLERRSEFLVDERAVDPNAIAVLTLTRLMARSLAERMPHGRAQTMHSFALEQLNRLGEAWNRRVADPWEVRMLVRIDLKLGVRRSFGVNLSLTDDIDPFLDRLGAAFRAEQDEPAQMTVVERQLHEVFQHQRELFRYRLLDELVFNLLRLIEGGAELAEPPTHVLADEYQDFTAGELRLLQVLSQRYGATVEVCGDDRQSIYGFREADALALHRFPAVYNVDPQYLWRSRRCPATICRFANLLADSLPPLPGIERPPLVEWPGREDEGVVRVVSAPSPIGEARWVMAECLALVESGTAPSDIGVVTAGYFEDVFRALTKASEETEDPPFSFVDPRANDPLSEDKAVRILSASARLLIDEHDHMAWRTLVWATPGLADARLTSLLTAGEADYERNLGAVADRDAVCGRPLRAGREVRARFAADEEVGALAVVEFASTILGIEDLDLTSLTTLAGEQPERTCRDWLAAIFERSEDEAPEAEAAPDTTIPVRTIFGAKGLQAPIVFLMNAIPQVFFVGGDPADGIRRLYVGVTRASSQIVVTAPRNLRGSSLQHKVNANYGGLPDLITAAAAQLDIDVEVLA